MRRVGTELLSGRCWLLLWFPVTSHTLNWCCVVPELFMIPLYIRNQSLSFNSVLQKEGMY